MNGPDQAALVQAMAVVAASRTGFRLEAIALDVIARMVSALCARGVSAGELLSRVLARDPDIVPALERAVAVGETYFFRQPEHFELVATKLAPARVASSTLRAWCGGCATGEEAYSLAATLLYAAPSLQLDVLGTDLVHESIATAQDGRYHARSLRSRAPLYPLLQRTGDEELAIDEAVRAVTRFEVHNLLEPLPLDWGRFDLILCRNVFVYFTPAARATALAHVTAALADDGVVLFSPLDLTEAPPGLVAFGRSELQAYRRRQHPPPRRLPAVPTPLARTVSASAPCAAADGAIDLHLRALVELDAGELRGAAVLLSELVAGAPSYVPGLVDRALLYMRQGQRASAMGLMRQVLRMTADLEADATIAGPEPLPVRFYAATAHAFLERQGGGS